MRPFKTYSLVACLIFSSLLFLPSFNLYATEYYALRLSGSNCILCHTDPKTGSLNQVGALFQEEGYRYPFTWKSIFFHFLGGLTLFFILFVFPYLESFDSDRSYSGVYILSFVGSEVLGFQNLSLFSSNFRPLRNSWINRDNINHLQEIYSETQRVRQSTDRWHFSCSPPFYFS